MTERVGSGHFLDVTRHGRYMHQMRRGAPASNGPVRETSARRVGYVRAAFEALAPGVGVRRVSLAAVLFSCALLAIGCGAKTGLDVPDAAIDAAIDARSLDAGVPLDSSVPCIELVPDAGPVELPLDTQIEVGRADVVFLVDVTASMDQEIEQITTNLRKLRVFEQVRREPDFESWVSGNETKPSPAPAPSPAPKPAAIPLKTPSAARPVSCAAPIPRT